MFYYHDAILNCAALINMRVVCTKTTTVHNSLELVNYFYIGIPYEYSQLEAKFSYFASGIEDTECLSRITGTI